MGNGNGNGHRVTGRVTIQLLGILLFAAPLTTFAQIRENNGIINVFLPAPRELRQHLSRARRAIGDKNYSRAVSELGAILTSDPAEFQQETGGEAPQDFFIEDPDNPGTQTSLKAEAQRLLGLLPPQGRQLYELQFGTDARTALQDAIRRGSIFDLTEVSRKFFHTKAGYEATLLLGRYELDQGRPLASALSLSRLMSTSIAPTMEPDLSLLLASAWLYSDMPESAVQVLKNLKRTHPNALVKVGEKKAKLFSGSGDPADWLRKLIGHVRSSGIVGADQWIMFRGNATRTAVGTGGFPMLKHRWRLPTTSTKEDEQELTNVMQQFSIDRVAAIPSAHPLAISDHVILRTHDGVLGVNMKTGKRIWEYPWFQSVDEEYLAQSQKGRAATARNTRLAELKSRFLEDAPYGQLSSDGKLVFLVSDLGMTQRTGALVLNRGFNRTTPRAPSVHNRLVALELESEGSMKWIVGGESGTDEPAMAGAFFLGPPLPIQGQLYGIAEFNGEIRLVVLNARTGKHIWSQQLADLENFTVAQDRTRRMAGAVPSFANGVLVCPTSAGAIVAVDVATRSLLWGHQYKQLRSGRYRSGFGVVVTSRTAKTTIGNRWADGALTIADGAVIATPMESNVLICLDLLSGKPRWKTKKRDDMLYVAAVDKQRLIVVGSETVRAINLKDGSMAWDELYEFRDETPTGRGFASKGHYYIPTTASRIVKIKLDDGRAAGAIETDKVLGNLISYDGQIISQTATDIRAYHQIEQLREMVKKGLVERPDDLWVMKRHAELLLHDKKYDEALAVLRALRTRHAEDIEIRELLIQAAMVNLERDFASNRKIADEIRPLLDEPQERAEFLQLYADGLRSTGESESAFEIYLQLTHLNSATTSLVHTLRQVEPGLRVHQDRWLQGRIASLLKSSSDDDQTKMNAQVDRERDEALAAKGLTPLREFATHFSSYPHVNQVEFELAKRLVNTGETLDAEQLEAEVLLNRVVNRKDEFEGRALALLAELYRKTKRFRDASKTYEVLARRFANDQVFEGKTGQELATLAQTDEELQKAVKKEPEWRYSPVTVKMGGGNTGFRYERYTQVKVDYRVGVPDDLTVMLNISQSRLQILDGYGRPLTNLALNEQSRRVSILQDSNRCQIYGHLIILQLGKELLAIDWLRSGIDGNAAILWRKPLFSVIGNQISGVVRLKSFDDPWGNSVRRYAVDDRPTGQVGRVSRHGVVFQRQRELVCVDLITGNDLWVRHKMPEHCEVYCSHEFVYVFPPEENRYWVFDIHNGKLLEEQIVKDGEKRWTANGAKLLSYTKKEDGRVEMRCIDLEKGAPVWNKTYPTGSKGTLIGNDRLAVMRPSGKLVIHDWLTGEQVFDVQLRQAKNLTKLYVMDRGDRYIVLTHYDTRQPSQVMVPSVGVHAPGISGEVYSLTKDTGQPTWSSPVTVRGYVTNLNLPRNIPLMTFLRHESSSLTRSRSQRPISLFCIDLRDGAQVKGPHRVPTTYMGAIGIAGDPKEQEVTITLSGQRVIMKFTDKDRVPAPPRQDFADGVATPVARSSDPFGNRFFAPQFQR